MNLLCCFNSCLAKQTIDEDQNAFLHLPSEILLKICNDLETAEVNALRATSRRFRVLIDGSAISAYKSRFVHIEVCTMVSISEAITLTIVYRHRSIKIAFVRGICRQASGADHVAMSAPVKKSFLNKSLNKCCNSHRTFCRHISA